MSIDGIGKPPGTGIGGIGSVPSTAAVQPTESFKIGANTPATPGGKVSAALSSLQRGELSLDQYLDGRVTDATSHLEGKLSPDQLAFVKQSLRDQMASDPVLVELLQRTTGAAPASELR